MHCSFVDLSSQNPEQTKPDDRAIVQTRRPMNLRPQSHRDFLHRCIGLYVPGTVYMRHAFPEWTPPLVRAKQNNRRCTHTCSCQRHYKSAGFFQAQWLIYFLQISTWLSLSQCLSVPSRHLRSVRNSRFSMHLENDGLLQRLCQATSAIFTDDLKESQHGERGSISRA